MRSDTMRRNLLPITAVRAVIALVTLPAALVAAMGAQAQAPAPTAPTPSASTPGAPGAGTPAAPAAPAGASPATAPGSSTPNTMAPAPVTPAADPLAAMAWLQGCWRGTVNQREFREQWLPPAGGMMIGASHTVMQGRTQDYEYLRLEVQPGGMRYVALPSGQKESTFRFEGATRDEVNPADIFTFANTVEGYPQRIVYRHGGEGWLYAQVEGAINGTPRNVTYPMRHVDCETGDVLHK